VMPDKTVVAAVVAVIPVAITFAVVLDKTVAASTVAATSVAMAHAVPPDKSVVMVPAVIRSGLKKL